MPLHPDVCCVLLVLRSICLSFREKLLALFEVAGATELFIQTFLVFIPHGRQLLQMYFKYV